MQERLAPALQIDPVGMFERAGDPLERLPAHVALRPAIDKHRDRAHDTLDIAARGHLDLERFEAPRGPTRPHPPDYPFERDSHDRYRRNGRAFLCRGRSAPEERRGRPTI